MTPRRWGIITWTEIIRNDPIIFRGVCENFLCQPSAGVEAGLTIFLNIIPDPGIVFAGRQSQ